MNIIIIIKKGRRGGERLLIHNSIAEKKTTGESTRSDIPHLHPYHEHHFLPLGLFLHTTYTMPSSSRTHPRRFSIQTLMPTSTSTPSPSRIEENHHPDHLLLYKKPNHQSSRRSWFRLQPPRELLGKISVLIGRELQPVVEGHHKLHQPASILPPTYDEIDFSTDYDLVPSPSPSCSQLPTPSPSPSPLAQEHSR